MQVMEDLFARNEGLEQIPMQDAEVYYWSHFLPAERAQTVLQHLIENVPWREEHIIKWGKRGSVPIW